MLSETRRLVADARPALRDLRAALRRPGRDNDLNELVDAMPPLADVAVVTKRARRGAGRTPGERGRGPRRLPAGGGRALRDATPVIAFARPHTTDFLGWLDDFSTTGGFYDALGGTTRVYVSLRREPHRRTTEAQPVPPLPRGRGHRGPRPLEPAELRGARAPGLPRRGSGRCDEASGERGRRALRWSSSARSWPLGAGGGRSDSRTYRIVFDNAFGLVEGGDFRIGGVRAGQTTRFEITPARTGPPKATVVAEVTRAGFGDLRRDATCTIEPQSLVGEYFVDCQPGSSPERLPRRRHRSRCRQTKGTIPADLVNDMLRRPARERLRLLVASLGTGLAGRPEEIGAVLRRAHPGLRETSETLRILGAQNRDIRSFLRDADTVVAALEDAQARRRGASSPRPATPAAIGGIAPARPRRRRCAACPACSPSCEPSMRALAEPRPSRAPRWPASSSGRRPTRRPVLRRVRPFAAQRAARLCVALGEAAVPAEQALREGPRGGRRPCAPSPSTRRRSRKPLRQLLQTLDDRRRAIDDDPRAIATEPAARAIPPSPGSAAASPASRRWPTTSSGSR